MSDSVITDKLKDFITESGLSFKQTSVSWVFNCPKCDKKNKLYLRKRDGAFTCFYCAGSTPYKGRAERVLADLTGQSIRLVREKIYGVNHHHEALLPEFDLSSFLDGTEKEIEKDLPVVHMPFDFYDLDYKNSKDGVAYLASRGIPIEVAKEYGVRFCPRMRRIIFPVQAGPFTLGWQDRTIDPSSGHTEDGIAWSVNKSVTSKGLDRNQVVMFQDRLLNSEHAIICEGPIDAIKAHGCGGNIATMGKAVSVEQIKLIRSFGVKKIYLALDPDAAAEMNRLKKVFWDIPVYDMRPPKGKKDIGEMSFEEVRQLFETAPLVKPGDHFFYVPF